MSGYELSKAWFKWCGENRHLINSNHHALYFWVIEKANSLNWCTSFGLPTGESMHFLGISSYKTDIKTCEDLERFGFLKVVERSKNQYTSNIIELVIFTKATTKADTKATTKAQTKALPKQREYNKTNKLLNLETKKEEEKEKNTTSTFLENQVPDFIIAEQKKVTPHIAPDPVIDLERIEDKMRFSQMLSESVRKTNKINEAEFNEALEEFFLEQRAIEKVPKNESDHKKHFISWARFWAVKQKQNPNAPKKGRLETLSNQYNDILNQIDNGTF